MLIADEITKITKVRNVEYYDMQSTYDQLYAKSIRGENFISLMKIIQSDNNILLAYRNLKKNEGSKTPGADGISIKDIEKLDTQQYLHIVRNKFKWYQPGKVKRVEIPKHNGKMRPLGIPGIWDRIIQQCILQVLEPICEAKFYDYSYGFRPNRSAENAIRHCYNRAQINKLRFVVDIDIEGFFDNVNHCKLRKQLWHLGIRDKKLISIINRMLKAPILMPNQEIYLPTKGTPQGGILSPLLSNIVLNELDWWIANQWENFPNLRNTVLTVNKQGVTNKGGLYQWLRKTNLKEVYIVRYADDFKVFCRDHKTAKKIFTATEKWLLERLKLNISQDKSKIVDLYKNWSEFLGFKYKLRKKGGKYTIISRMSDKAVKTQIMSLKQQVCKIQKPDNKETQVLNTNLYNMKVIGLHNYYKIATHISRDCRVIKYIIDRVLFVRLKDALKRDGPPLQGYINKQYGKSQQIRYLNNKPIIPVGYVQHRYPKGIPKGASIYTPEGRAVLHKSLKFDITIMYKLMKQKIYAENLEFRDNRISLYCAQYGKCKVTGEILKMEEIRCHHIIPKENGGNDAYDNLVIIHEVVHRLIHATNQNTINLLVWIMGLKLEMLNKINDYRNKAGYDKIINSNM